MHGYRFWRTYPATPTPLERRRGNRVVATALAVGLLLCVVAIVVLFMFVLDLKHSRDVRQAEEQQRIDTAMCSVMAVFHGTSPDLEHARALLHCPPPGEQP